MSDEPQSPPTQTATEPGRPIGLWVPALLMALVVLGLWLPNLMRPPPPAWTVYSNVKGEIRRVILADKSVIRLNGASQVKVVYRDEDRRVDMGQAEAAFTMTPDEDKPFVIISGDRRLRIDGGEVNILRETTAKGAKTTLTVRQGQARIYAAGHLAEAIAAGPNQEVTWIDGQADQPQTRAVNAANAFAWESHRLAYDKTPLAEVVADLNRYVVRPIRIADPSLAALPFTGSLTLEGEDVMLRNIAAVLPIQYKAAAAEIVLTRGVIKPVVKKPNAIVTLLKLNKPKPLKLKTAPARLPIPRPIAPPLPKTQPAP